MVIVIETKNLWIRQIEPNDLDALLEVYKNPKNMRFIPNSSYRWTREKLERKYDEINKYYKNGFGIFVVQMKNKDIILGEAGLFGSSQDLNQLELGYIIAERFWRKGYGTEICHSLIEYGFGKLRLQKITARMFSQNIASIRLSEKCNMQLVKQEKFDCDTNVLEYEIKRI